MMTWTADGRFLVYWQGEEPSVKNPMPRRTAWIVDAGGGEPRRLDIPRHGTSLAFHPDGRRVATLYQGSLTDLWVLENLKFD